MPRVGLSPDAVVDEAIRQGNESGLHALKLSTVAAALGVKTPSLYKHIDGLPGLLDAMALRGYRALLGALQRAAVARTGPEAVRAVCLAYYEFALNHPALYAALTPSHIHHGPDVQQVALDLLELVYAVLRSVGVPPGDLVHAARSLRSFLHGFVQLQQGRGFGLDESPAASFDYAVEHWILGVRGNF